MEDGLNLNTILPGKARRKKRSPWAERCEHMIEVSVPFLAKNGFYLALIAVGVLDFLAFKQYYFRENPAFLVQPRDVIVHGNSVLSREMVLETFGLTAPRNGFELVQSEGVHRLQTQMPLLKQVQTTFEPGRGLELWVEERTPIARLANQQQSLAVDEEGVFFAYPRSREGYPEISGFDLPEDIEPSMRLRDNLRCMLHLIAATSEPQYRLPSRIRRVTLLGSDPDDGLLVSLYDGRKIEIAWDGMAVEQGFSDAMLKRLENLGKLLRDPRLSGKRHFNATASDRIAVSD